MNKKPFISWKSELPSVAVLGVIAAASAYFKNVLPERVVTHWGFAGEPDGWSSRGFVVWFFPLTALGLYLLMLSIWRLDPKRDRYIEFASAYHGVKTLLVVFLAAVYFLVVGNGLGYQISVPFFMPFMIGIMFAVIGIYMPTIKQNWFFGMRTPWTLSSEKVWDKTHRVAGHTFITGGVVAIVSAFFPASISTIIFFCVIFVSVLVPFVYSYVLFRQEKHL